MCDVVVVVVGMNEFCKLVTNGDTAAGLAFVQAVFDVVTISAFLVFGDGVVVSSLLVSAMVDLLA